MISIYAHGKVDAKNPSLDKRIFEEVKVVKKHKTIIWLNLAKGEAATDEIAVKLINRLADKAQEAGLKVVLYPHVTCLRRRLRVYCALLKRQTGRTSECRSTCAIS